jgi:hypothetical protein
VLIEVTGQSFAVLKRALRITNQAVKKNCRTNVGPAKQRRKI